MALIWFIMEGKVLVTEPPYGLCRNYGLAACLQTPSCLLVATKPPFSCIPIVFCTHSACILNTVYGILIANRMHSNSNLVLLCMHACCILFCCRPSGGPFLDYRHFWGANGGLSFGLSGFLRGQRRTIVWTIGVCLCKKATMVWTIGFGGAVLGTIGCTIVVSTKQKETKQRSMLV